MSQVLSCFKAYDVRGRIPDQLNEDIAYRIGCAYAAYLKPKKVVVGYDIRLSSQALCRALTQGLVSQGVDVYNIGQCGTEEIYFSTFHEKMDGGIMVTASHNPKDYNGMKFVREESKPISGDSGLNDIQRMAEKNDFVAVAKPGQTYNISTKEAFVKQLLSYVDVSTLKPLKIVSNPGNGGAGDIIDRLEKYLPFTFVKVHHQADGDFPHGVPNPLLIENRAPTIEAIQAEGADLGIAWDGDFDRCFFFDEKGAFIEGYYIVGLLAAAFLRKTPGAKIVHDPRLTWNTQEIVTSLGGVPIQSKTGHAFIKERMRKEDAVYGGEMSAHHYFRDFAYCDSGMIPWLLVVGLISASGKSLSALMAERMAAFPSSGEINNKIENPASAIERIEAYFQSSALEVDHTDGLSMIFEKWRFNLRMSNTEPVVRLNVETRADLLLLQEKTQLLLQLLNNK
jgi:phosphomannomutase